MSILRELGVNQTVWIQLGLFFICYLSLSQLLFKPYKTNLIYRQKNTGGSLEKANLLTADTEKLALQYQALMKNQNEAAQTVYDKIKAEGQVEEERHLADARKLAHDLIEQTKKKVAVEMASAQTQLKVEIPALSELIASRVLGRDLS